MGLHTSVYLPTKMARSNKSNYDLPKASINKATLSRTARIFKYVWPYKVYLFIGLLFLFGTSLLAMVFPYVTGKLVDAATEQLPEGWNRNNVAFTLIGILLIQGILSFARIQMFALVSENAMRDVRMRLYSRLIDLPMSFFEKHRVGELTSRITNDVTQLQDTLSITLAEFIRQILILIVGIGIIMFTSPELTLVMISSFPLLIIGAVFFGKYIRRLAKKTQDELAEANVVAEETLQNIHTVKAFVNERFEETRYRVSLNKVVGNALNTARYRGVFASFVIMAVFGGIVFVLWYGLGLVEANEITMGDLVAFVIYTVFVGAAVGSMGELYGQLQRAVGASERILETIEERSESDLHPYIKDVPPFMGEVEFKDVYFSYPSRPDVPVLRGLNFKVKPGQKVALVGHSGAGKSTIAQLLLRYHAAQSGSITIDGKNIYDIPVRPYRSHWAVVPQDVMLFGGTIRENIAYGDPTASDEDVLNAAKRAYALQFIQAFPDGMNTVVGDRGIKLSGGQRQRIAIARAILKDPELLILDEATSALDTGSETIVQQALEELMRDRTAIIIAHRLSTIRKVDTIYVIHEGQIVEQGNHRELLNKDTSIYKHLSMMQNMG